MSEDSFGVRCKALKLVLSDVDGVMTNGTVLLLPDGLEAKAFNIRDGLAIVMAHRAGLKTGVLSGRASEAVSRRAEELRMDVVRQGVRDKGAALREILCGFKLEAREVAYIGDDVNDLAVLRDVGLSAAPADACFDVRAEVFMITDARGGQGCLREFLEAILRARGDWDRVIGEL